MAATLGRLRPLALGAYVAAVMATGAVALGVTVQEWARVEAGLGELALFVLAAAVLDVMVVPIAGGGGVAASFAVLFAGLLVLGPAATAWVAALAAAWSEGVVRRRPIGRTAFNVSHSVLSVLGSGAVYAWLGGSFGRIDLGRWGAIVGAAIALWALETAWVSLAVVLERGGRIWRRLRMSLAPMLALDGALASAGLLLALLYQSREEFVGDSGWLGSLLLAAAVLIPCAMLYYAYRLRRALQAAYAQSLQTLGALVEAKVEGDRAAHGVEVARMAAAVAEALELPPEEVRQIRYAGYLHDIGKVALPSEALSRSRGWSGEESGAVRLHPEMGAEILRPVRFLSRAAEIVRAHHERWDGLGYPAGLRQSQIPIGARLLAMADAFVGMTASPTVDPSQALARLRQGAGSRFDPKLVLEWESVTPAAESTDTSRLAAAFLKRDTIVWRSPASSRASELGDSDELGRRAIANTP
jgi:putative nucleotidyltransferase with HDIG domain